MRKYFFVYIWPLILVVSVSLFIIEKVIEYYLFTGNHKMVFIVRLLPLLSTLGVFIGAIGTFLIAPIVLYIILSKNSKQNNSPPQNTQPFSNS